MLCKAYKCAVVRLVLLCYCLSLNIGGFWRVVCGALRFCRVAFPLVMLSRSIFSPLLAFRVFGCVLVGVFAFNAIVSDFKAFDGLLSVWRGDAFGMRSCRP